ncbi:hypothetical protein Daus18300_008700 [Diaporthe australafricana]|uniref:CAP-Gly domain-containing protein n=1 Tax=Diaporthe australafricana TaxID=127596 RepID=A0ABR3WH93_9PEZI
MTSSAEFRVGQRLSYDGALCTIRYIGQVAGTSGEWLGVEWDDPSRGKHDGSHKDARYFECLSKSPKAASFVRPTRTADQPRTFLQALHEKYAPGIAADQGQATYGKQIVISGKVAEEIGFDKISKQQAQLSELKIVILDGLRVSSASAPGEQPISEVCPKVIELDVSRSLIVDFREIVEMCLQLKALRRLGLNGNRYTNTLIADLDADSVRKAFKGVKELALDETLLRWDGICHIVHCFESLATFHASTNQLSRLPPSFGTNTAPETLTTVYLEFNDFTSLSDLACLAQLASLKNLHLKGNNISAVTTDASQETPVFSQTLTHLDISYNKISSWSFVDALPDSFPGLNSLRLAHNPIYEDPGFDNSSASSAPAAGAAAAAGSKATVTEEAYMITVGRLACLQALNFSAVTPTDRTNAEMFYLSRIGRQLSSVPDSPEAEATVTAQHRRYAELCELYDEPVVVRRTEVNPAFLEARLVNVVFRFCPLGQEGAQDEGGEGAVEEKRVQIPKAFDIYAVKGIAGRLFGCEPLKLRLIWETGEWDPVAGFEDAGDSSDEEDEGVAGEREAMEDAGAAGEDAGARLGSKTGRWIKREEELKNSPRQFGFCVDGLDVSIRLELR